MPDMKLLRPTKSQLKSWGKLRQVKYRYQEGLFLAEGFKIVQELLCSPWETRAVLVMDTKRPQWEDLLATVPKEISIYELSESGWGGLTQDKAPEGIMAIVAMPERFDITELLAHNSGHMLLLYQINNPGNLGALMRTAHWFGMETIITSIGSADFTNPKVVRSSMGSIFHLRVVANIDFAEFLPEIKQQYFLVGSHVKKGILPHASPRKTALLLGSESHGLPEALILLTDEQWNIPGVAGADSLSLPQAAAIMMYECTKSNSQFQA